MTNSAPARGSPHRDDEVGANIARFVAQGLIGNNEGASGPQYTRPSGGCALRRCQVNVDQSTNRRRHREPCKEAQDIKAPWPQRHAANLLARVAPRAFAAGHVPSLLGAIA